MPFWTVLLLIVIGVLVGLACLGCWLEVVDKKMGKIVFVIINSKVRSIPEIARIIGMSEEKMSSKIKRIIMGATDDKWSELKDAHIDFQTSIQEIGYADTVDHQIRKKTLLVMDVVRLNNFKKDGLLC
jgi:hypothetical protein